MEKKITKIVNYLCTCNTQLQNCTATNSPPWLSKWIVYLSSYLWISWAWEVVLMHPGKSATFLQPIKSKVLQIRYQTHVWIHREKGSVVLKYHMIHNHIAWNNLNLYNHLYNLEICEFLKKMKITNKIWTSALNEPTHFWIIVINELFYYSQFQHYH